MGGAAGCHSRGWGPKQVGQRVGVTNCHRSHKGHWVVGAILVSFHIVNPQNGHFIAFFSFFLLAMHRYHSWVHVYNITLVIGMEMQARESILQTHTNFGTIDPVMTVGMFHGSEKYQQSQLWDAPSLPVVWHLCYTLSSSEFDVQDTQHDNFVQHSTNLPSRSSCLFQHSRKLTNSLAWTRVKTCPGLPRSTLHKSCYHACLNNLSHLSDWMAVDPLHLEPYSVRWGRMGKHEQPHQVCFIRRRLHMKMKHLFISRTRKAITMAAYCMMHDFRAQGTRTILSLLSIKWSERDCSIDITKYIPECPSDSWERIVFHK